MAPSVRNIRRHILDQPKQFETYKKKLAKKGKKYNEHSHVWGFSEESQRELRRWLKWLKRIPLISPRFIRKRVTIITDAATTKGLGGWYPETRGAPGMQNRSANDA